MKGEGRAHPTKTETGRPSMWGYYPFPGTPDSMSIPKLTAWSAPGKGAFGPLPGAVTITIDPDCPWHSPGRGGGSAERPRPRCLGVLCGHQLRGPGDHGSRGQKRKGPILARWSPSLPHTGVTTPSQRSLYRITLSSCARRWRSLGPLPRRWQAAAPGAARLPVGLVLGFSPMPS